MIAAAFAAVRFPVLPVLEQCADGTLRMIPRNSRLFTPRDFDYSPYFDIIKCPHLEFSRSASYRNLPWDSEGRVCNGHGDYLVPALAERAEGPCASPTPNRYVQETNPDSREAVQPSTDPKGR